MEAKEETLDLKQYWLIVKRRWLPGIVVFSSVLAMTAVYTFTQKPVYEAEAQVLLKDSTTAALSGFDQEAGALGSLTSKSSPLDTESAIIRSVPIVQKVITTLQLKDRKGNPLTPEDFVKRLSVLTVKGTDILAISYRSTKPEQALEVVEKLVNVYITNNIDMNRSDIVAAREFTERQLPIVASELRNLDATLRRFKETNQVLDLTAEASSSTAFDSKLNEMAAASELRRTDAQAKVAALQRKLDTNSQLGRQVNTLSQSPAIAEALTQMQQAETELAVARAQLQSEHPQVQSLEEKRDRLKALLRTRVGEVLDDRAATNVKIKDLQASKTDQLLIETMVTAEVDRLASESQIAALEQLKTNNRERMSKIPRLEQTFSELERRRTVAQLTYETLLKSLQTLRLTENQSYGNVRVIQSAILARDPVAPRIPLNLALGLLLASLLTLATILLLEIMDTSVKSAEDVQELFDSTLLSSIPLLKTGRDRKAFKGLERPVPKLILRDEPRSVASEAYRTLQTNLKFLSSADKPIKTIVLTSSVPKEGKSTVSANLALAITEMGYKVLLIDADLRLPSQHQIWELPNSRGLTNAIAEPIDPATVIHEESELLHIMTAGLLPPNPLALLDSDRLSVLIDNFSDTYDYVLIDTPPLAAAVDALLLGKKADGILLVARPGTLETPVARSTRESLENSGQKLLGIVANGVVLNKEFGNYYAAVDANQTADANQTIDVTRNGHDVTKNGKSSDKAEISNTRL